MQAPDLFELFVSPLNRIDARYMVKFSSPDFYRPPLDVMEAEVARLRHGHFNVIHVETTLKADFYPVDGDPRRGQSQQSRVQSGHPEGARRASAGDHISAQSV